MAQWFRYWKTTSKECLALINRDPDAHKFMGLVFWNVRSENSQSSLFTGPIFAFKTLMDWKIMTISCTDGWKFRYSQTQLTIHTYCIFRIIYTNSLTNYLSKHTFALLLIGLFFEESTHRRITHATMSFIKAIFTRTVHNLLFYCRNF